MRRLVCQFFDEHKEMKNKDLRMKDEGGRMQKKVLVFLTFILPPSSFSSDFPVHFFEVRARNGKLERPGLWVFFEQYSLL